MSAVIYRVAVVEEHAHSRAAVSDGRRTTELHQVVRSPVRVAANDLDRLSSAINRIGHVGALRDHGRKDDVGKPAEEFFQMRARVIRRQELARLVVSAGADA
jgi:hypothetical protein